MTRKELERADRNLGRRGFWLKLLDRLPLGFACRGLSRELHANRLSLELVGKAVV